MLWGSRSGNVQCRERLSKVQNLTFECIPLDRQSKCTVEHCLRFKMVGEKNMHSSSG